MNWDGHTVGEVLCLKDHGVTVGCGCGVSVFILDIDRFFAESFFKKAVEGAVMTSGTLYFNGFRGNLRSFRGISLGAGDGKVEEGYLGIRSLG